MLSRKEIDKRLAALDRHIQTSYGASNIHERAEREALETAAQLAEWLRWFVGCENGSRQCHDGCPFNPTDDDPNRIGECDYSKPSAWLEAPDA